MSALIAQSGWLGFRNETKDMYAARLQRLVAARQGVGPAGASKDAGTERLAGGRPHCQHLSAEAA
jgi:hypothetical protein